MFTVFRKCSVVVAIVSLSFALFHCPASAAMYTIDAKNDGGLQPGQLDFVKFLLADSSTVNVPSSASPFVSANSVFAYAENSANGITPGWSLQSAGDIWNPSQTAIGVTTPLLSAGTYHISVAGGAFSYDSFNWSNSPNYYQQWLWYLNIGSEIPSSTVGGASQLNYYTLGSNNFYGSPAEALAASQNAFIDITLAGPGYLSFWIYDTNSIDNVGSLQVDLAAVPLPSTLLLLLSGVPFLFPRIRHFISG